MSSNFSTTGSIATFIYNSFSMLPPAISGNVVDIVDISRQNVANYTGVTIDANSIPEAYQPAIVNFTMAEVLSLVGLNPETRSLSLAELSIGGNPLMNGDQYRMLAEMKLKALGRKVQWAKSLS